MKKIILSDGVFEDYTSAVTVASIQDFEGESTDPLLAPRIPSTEERFEGSDQAVPLTQKRLTGKLTVKHDNYETADVKGNTAEYAREQLRLARRLRQQAGLPDMTREEEEEFKDAAKSEYAARLEQAKWNSRARSDNAQQDAKDWALEEMRRRRRAGLDMTAEEQRQLKADLQELYESKVGIGESDDEGVCNLCGSESGTASICDSCKENLEDFDEEEQKEKNKNEDLDPAKHGDGG